MATAPTMKLGPREAGHASVPRRPDVPAEAQAGRPFGPYLRVKLLGAGGMGEVWKAWDTAIGRWVALKLLKHDDPDEVARFRREAQTAGQLDHPNIARIYDVGEIDGRPYITMQFVDGHTILDHRADACDLAALVRDAALAVHAAHENGIIHRDLKPQNLMVETHGPGSPRAPHEAAPVARGIPDRGRVYVLDFGLAKQMSVDSAISATGTVLGTPAYMPPEQARAQPADARSDVYGLGATLYHLLARRAPIPGEGTYEVLTNVEEIEPVPPGGDPDLETIVMRCLEKQPARRFATALELADDLTRWLQGEAILSHAPSLTYKMRKYIARRRPMAGIAISTVALLVAIGVIVVPGLLRERHKRRQSEAALASQRDRERADRDARDRAARRVEAGELKLRQFKFLRQNPKTTPAEFEAVTREAAAEFEAARKEGAHLPQALVGLGRAKLAAGDRDEAIAQFTKSIETAPTFAPAYLERARIRVVAYDQKRHDIGGVVTEETPETVGLRREIEEDLAAVERHSLEKQERLSGQAMLAFGDGNYAAAEEALVEFLKIVPNDAEAILWRGHALFHLNRFEEAEAALDRSIALDAHQWESFFHRAGTRLAGGKRRAAVEDLDRLLELHPTYGQGWLQRSKIHHQLQNYEQAVRDATEAIRLQPDSANAHAERGLARLVQDRYDDAIRDFDEAIRLRPTYAAAYYNRGYAWQLKRDPRRAIAEYDLAIRHQPTFVLAFTNRGIARMSLQDFQGAKEDFDRALTLDPGQMQARSNRASIHGMMGDLESAIADYDVVVRDHPEIPDAWYNRGLTHFYRKDWKAALADFTETLKRREDHLQALLYRGMTYVELREYEKAVGDYDAAERIAPEWATVF